MTLSLWIQDLIKTHLEGMQRSELLKKLQTKRKPQISFQTRRFKSEERTERILNICRTRRFLNETQKKPKISTVLTVLIRLAIILECSLEKVLEIFDFVVKRQTF
jgi:hypothetical protein